MGNKIELSKSRAKKLVDAWEGHQTDGIDIRDCFRESTKCPIHKYFMEIKRKCKNS